MPAKSKMKNHLTHIRPEILTMGAYHVPDASGLIKLDAMENPYTLPDDLKAQLAQELAQVAMNRYPVPTYTALKDELRRYAQIPADKDILLGNGSDELIAIISQAIAKQGETVTVLAPAPSFVMYKISGLLNHLNVVEIPLSAHDFSLDEAAWLAAIETHQPALVYLPFPNNPTGNLFDESVLRRVISTARNSIVVVDEAYQPFAQATWMSALDEFDHLLVMRTVSKLGLAGIRLGYMAGSHALIFELDKVRPPYNVNVLTEAAATFVLRHADVLSEQAELIRTERTHVCAELAKLPQVQVFETAANFVLIRLDDSVTADEVFAGMKARSVLIKNISGAHPLLRNCLRITVSTPEENAAMLAALSGALDELSGDKE